MSALFELVVRSFFIHSHTYIRSVMSLGVIFALSPPDFVTAIKLRAYKLFLVPMLCVGMHTHRVDFVKRLK